MKRTLVGIDLGGTKIEVARIDVQGVVEERYREFLQNHTTPDGLWEQITRMVARVRLDSTVAAGLAHPGISDPDGVLRNTPNIPYLEGVDGIGETLAKWLGLPVRTDNDANCFALAEASFGSARDVRVMMGLIWGTGIGGGAVIDGRIFRGGFGGAMEIGRTVLSSGEEQRDIEHWCTGTYPRERYRSLGGMQENVDMEYMFMQYPQDAVAAQIRGELLTLMAQALANWTYVLQPEVIVVGGGVSNSPIYDDLRRLYRQCVLPSLGRDVRIVPHSLGDAAGALGAVALWTGEYL